MERVEMLLLVSKGDAMKFSALRVFHFPWMFSPTKSRLLQWTRVFEG